MSVDPRKREESQFHDLLRSPALRDDPASFRRLTANKKYYAVARKSRTFFEDRLIQHAAGSRVLDYGCGDGYYAILAARHGAQAVGIDISEVSVENARREAARQGVSDRAVFHVMDAEILDFQDDSFDIVCEAGVMHHLAVDAAMQEIARVLRPAGCVICAEALGHNPFFQLYRRLTPHLRTSWKVDHIVRRGDVLRSLQWFEQLEIHFFHLISLAAVPFRATRVFPAILSVLEQLDDAVLRLPGVQWYAWQAIYILTDPRKHHAP